MTIQVNQRLLAGDEQPVSFTMYFEVWKPLFTFMINRYKPSGLIIQIDKPHSYSKYSIMVKGANSFPWRTTEILAVKLIHASSSSSIQKNYTFFDKIFAFLVQFNGNRLTIDTYIDRQIFRQTDMYIDGQIFRQIGIYIDTYTDRQVYTQIYRYIVRQIGIYFDIQVYSQINRYIDRWVFIQMDKYRQISMKKRPDNARLF